MTERAVKSIILEQLVKFNLKRIYGYAGDTILPFFSELKGSPLRLYTTKHESTAGLMASAEAKATGQLAVCVAHSGPGTANIINGIADAYSDRVPLLLLTGQVETYNIGTNYKQFVKQQELTNPLTVYSQLLIHPEAVVDILYQAMINAVVKGGVSQVVIPLDLWNKKSSALPREYPPHLQQKILPAAGLIDQAVEAINRAERPAVIFGRGVKECREELLSLAGKINGALINTLPAAGIVDFNHPLSLGGLGLAGSKESAYILDEADLIIILGATWWPPDYTPRKPAAVQIDAVKENIGLMHPVNVGIVSDMQPALQMLNSKLAAKNNSDWVELINCYRKSWLEELNRQQNISEPISPEEVIRAVSSNALPGEIYTLDSGDNVVWFSRYFGNTCRDILVSGTWRTMGFGLPAALAARLNYPEAPVTCITGDGGLTMVMAELLTASQYRLPVRIVVMNNGTLAMEKNRMEVAGLNIAGVDLNNPDFVKIAEACGLKAYHCSSTDELNRVLRQTAGTEEPVLLDVATADKIVPGTRLN